MQQNTMLGYVHECAKPTCHQQVDRDAWIRVTAYFNGEFIEIPIQVCMDCFREAETLSGPVTAAA